MVIKRRLPPILPPFLPIALINCEICAFVMASGSGNEVDSLVFSLLMRFSTDDHRMLAVSMARLKKSVRYIIALVSVASKGLRFAVSGLESTLAGCS